MSDLYKIYASQDYVDQKVSDLVNSAPETLDTLGELATALQENKGVTDALDAAIGNKANASDLNAHIDNKENPHNVTAEQIGAITEETDPTVSAWAKAATKPSYTAEEVGALPKGTKIPSALSDLTADSTHRTVTDAEKATWSAKSNFSGSYNDLTNKPNIPSIAGLATESYVNSAIGEIDYPVDSVNGKTGAVNLTASDVGALPSTTVIPSKVSQLSNDSGYITGYTETDPTVPAWAKAASKPSYTAAEVGAVPTGRTVNGKALSANISLGASDVGADASGTASSLVSTHNASNTAHSDIRNLISGLTTRLNALADSDDTTLDQLSEIVAYIKANKSLIDGITTSKVNVADIINNLTTDVANKPLSAAQGVAIKGLIDALQNEVNGKAKASDLTSHTGNTSNPHSVTKAQVGLGNVENKSSATIRGELTKTDVITALGYTPPTQDTTYTLGSFGITATAAELNYVDGVTSNVQTQLGNKVDKVSGKGLSTNDFTAAYKSKLDGIAAGANAYTLPVAGSALGGVKSGGDITVASDGTVSVNVREVPACSTSDNGKILRVVNGVATWASIANAEGASF